MYNTVKTSQFAFETSNQKKILYSDTWTDITSQAAVN